MAIEVQRVLTRADVEQMVRTGELRQDDFWEFVNGEIVRLAPAFDPQGPICALIIAEIVPFARQIHGRVGDGQTGFWVGEHFQQLRAPDVSLVTKERLHIVQQQGFNTAAPDLAVEVLSGSEFGRAYSVTKLNEYFAAGSKVVWFVDSRDRSVREHFPNETEFRVYRGDAAITLDAIAPGFSCPVSRFFPEE